MMIGRLTPLLHLGSMSAVSLTAVSFGVSFVGPRSWACRKTVLIT